MRRRAFLALVAKTGAVVSLGAVPLSRLAGGVARTTQAASGWVQVLGRRGEVAIEVSPRFLVEHPEEYLRILTEAAR